MCAYLQIGLIPSNFVKLTQSPGENLPGSIRQGFSLDLSDGEEDGADARPAAETKNGTTVTPVKKDAPKKKSGVLGSFKKLFGSKKKQ